MPRFFFLFLFFFVLASCGKNDPAPAGDLEDISYDPQAYEWPELPYFFPEMIIPEDNPMTEEGVELGRHLFYDPILSRDNTISCASCHQVDKAFTDGLSLSKGIEGGQTKRNAMSLTNVGFFRKACFGDGRVKTLEQLSLHPILDPVEMDNTLEEVEKRLREHPDYPRMFREAFGIRDRSEISAGLLGKAIAQFTRTMVSYNSKFDYANWDRGAETQFFTASELRGKNLFNFEPIDQSDQHPGCDHCHTGSMMTTNEYLNNGLNEALQPSDFPDPGLGGITSKDSDYGKFRVPTLRNVELTAPYMHDGRFQTLEEVLDHYSSGGHYAVNVDANIQPFTLSQQDREDLIAFLKTMTDTAFIQNPALQSPF